MINDNPVDAKSILKFMCQSACFLHAAFSSSSRILEIPAGLRNCPCFKLPDDSINLNFERYFQHSIKFAPNIVLSV
jgi:hypothetical protein